jgi:fibronectin-binding autotransporter adhesin
MKFSKLSYLGSSLLLSLSSLFFMLTPGIAHATNVTLYWCNDSSSNTDDFNTASNWNTDSDCSSGTQEVPVSGDSLVFDNTNLTGGIAVNNDIASLSLDNITFQGSNISDYGYEITGDGLSLSGGISNTGSAILNSIDTDVILTSDQTFSNSGGYFDIGASSGSNTLNTSTYNLTLSDSLAGGVININNNIVGSGQLITDATQSVGNYQLNASNPNFSGAVIDNAGVLSVFDDSSLGTGAVTVANGATLSWILVSANDTISNPITISGDGSNQGGSGDQGALNVSDVCSSGNTCANDGTTTFSGPITLDSDSTVGTPATVDVSSIVSNGYNLSLQSGYNGTLNVVGESSAVSSGAAVSKIAPKTPDTGSSLTSAKVTLPLFGSVIAASGMYILSRRVKKFNR